MNNEFHGVWPAMLTPLDNSGNPNEESIERLVELYVNQNLGGLYILGSTGQWPLLPLGQRLAVADRVVKAAAKRIPVIVHVGAAATDDAIELARHAESIGADGVSSVAPIYYPTTADDVFLHYRKIGEASRLPLFVYHLSSINQVNLKPHEYTKRVLELPNIGGMKITDHDLFSFGVIADVAGDRLRLFSGADPLICHAALSGACGAIGTFFNLWGEPAKRARAAFVAGDFNGGRRFTSALQIALAEILDTQSIWTFLQSAMRLRHGIDIGMPRAPLGAQDQPWEDGDVERLVAQVEHAAA